MLQWCFDYLELLSTSLVMCRCMRKEGFHDRTERVNKNQVSPVVLHGPLQSIYSLEWLAVLFTTNKVESAADEELDFPRIASCPFAEAGRRSPFHGSDSPRGCGCEHSSRRGFMQFTTSASSNDQTILLCLAFNTCMCYLSRSIHLDVNCQCWTLFRQDGKQIWANEAKVFAF